MSPTANTVATGSAGDEEGAEGAAADVGVEGVAAAVILLWAPLAHPAMSMATRQRSYAGSGQQCHVADAVDQLRMRIEAVFVAKPRRPRLVAAAPPQTSSRGKVLGRRDQDRDRGEEHAALQDQHGLQSAGLKQRGGEPVGLEADPESAHADREGERVGELSEHQAEEDDPSGEHDS